jgi:type I restriction enzyme, R subunit
LAAQTEKELEDTALHQIETQLNYTYQRALADDASLTAHFRTCLDELNKDNLNGRTLSDTEFDRVLTYLYDKTVYVSAKQLRDTYVLERDDAAKIYITFIDFDNPERNKIEIARQITECNKYETRFDVTLLINGIPVVQLELKKPGVDINEAFNQTERYRRTAYRRLFRYIQIFVISCGVETRYYANSDVPLERSKAFYWTDRNNRRINNLDEFISAFLERKRLFSMLDRYTVITDTEHTIMIMRPYQVFATESLLDRAVHTRENGYVWHTTGSGKTLTCWKCAKLLAAEPGIKKVIFLVDRKDLDTQTTDDFNSYEADSVDPTDKTDTLVSHIEDKNRKLVISTIEKMAIAVSTPKYEKRISSYRNEKVVFLIDECHRTQFGDMHTQIKKYFAKAQYFGFTGTPIFKENAHKEGEREFITESLFGSQLHRYMIKEAIADGNVLGFKIEYLSTFYGSYDENDPAKADGIDTGEVYENQQRIELICRDIETHFNSKTNNREYNALLAVQSVPLLIKYYDTFKRINTEISVAAVFTYNVNEDPENKEEFSQDALSRIIKEYDDKYNTSFDTAAFTEYNKDVSKRFKAGGINLLLVVDMYLTGYNSKMLNTLYIDKNLKYQGLLQAFSRTNRTGKSTKPFGNIVCYRNIKQETDAALKLYSRSDDLTGVVEKDYAYFVNRLQTALGMLYRTAETPEDAANLQSEKEKLLFVKAFREVMKQVFTLKTFDEFRFTEDDLGIDEQTFNNYKSIYSSIHDQVIKYREGQKESILANINFEIELLETDIVNVDYILHLMTAIDFTNRKQKERDIKKLFDTIDNSGNRELRKKADLIKEFLEKVVSGLSSAQGIEEKFAAFEEQQRIHEMQTYSIDHHYDSKKLEQLCSQYEFSGILRKDEIRRGITDPSLGLLAKESAVNDVQNFVYDICAKYSYKNAL